MNISHLKINKTRWAKIAFAVIVLAAIFYWRVEFSQFFSMVGDREAIVDFLQPYGVLGPLVLFVILTLQVFMAVIPGHAFIVAGGYVYGLLVGAVITQISTVFASQLAYLLVRRFGRPLVDRIAPAQIVDHWNQLAERQGGLFFFFAFILPIFPNDLMAFVAGLSSISSRKFFVANFFGRLTCAIFVTLIGSHGFEMPLYFWLVAALVMLGLCILWKYFSPLIEKRLFHKVPPTQCLC